MEARPGSLGQTILPAGVPTRAMTGAHEIETLIDFRFLSCGCSSCILYKPAPYLLIASVTTLFDVRRISFPAPGKSFINVHKSTGIKRTSNRNKTEIIGKLAEMSAERGGF